MTGQAQVPPRAVRPVELDRPDLPCRRRDPEAWFPVDGRLAGDDAYAAGLCAGCPAITECLGYALDTRQGDGVWGGVSERTRQQWLRQTLGRRRALLARRAEIRPGSWQDLTAAGRRDAVAACRARGMSPAAIAGHLGISERTVHRYTPAIATPAIVLGEQPQFSTEEPVAS